MANIILPILTLEAQETIAEAFNVLRDLINREFQRHDHMSEKEFFLKRVDRAEEEILFIVKHLNK